MTIKDWKRRGKFNEWKNKNIREIIIIWSTPYGSWVEIFYSPEGPRFSLNSAESKAFVKFEISSSLQKKIGEKRYDTIIVRALKNARIKALKYAKSYMRKH